MIMCTCDKTGFRAAETAESITMKQILAVTSRHLCSRPLPAQMERVCSLRPRAVILREKDLEEEEYARLAEEIMKICREHHIPCILHTFIDTARKLNCPAIHLPLALLRKYRNQLDSFTVTGTSIHSVEEAMEAQKLGATYITAGHIYATDCKKGLPPRGTDFLRSVCENVSIPVYAIGGIRLDGMQPDEEQMHEIMECGAAGGCIMSGMMEI